MTFEIQFDNKDSFIVNQYDENGDFVNNQSFNSLLSTYDYKHDLPFELKIKKSKIFRTEKLYLIQ